MKSVRFKIVLLALLSSWGCAQPKPVDETAAAPAQVRPATPQPATQLIAISNARVPADGLLTGGQPTEEQIERVARSGFKTVVNLRPAGEEGAWDEEPKVTQLGMRYISIPVAGTTGLTPENARQLAAVVDDEELYPLFVHCASGNRVGALFALKAFHLDGENAETALRIGQGAGLTGLTPVVEQLLGQAQEASDD